MGSLILRILYRNTRYQYDLHLARTEHFDAHFHLTMMNPLTLVLVVLGLNISTAFVSPSLRVVRSGAHLSAEAWTGEVAGNSGGEIQGCTLTQVDGSTTEWTIFIDG